MKLMLNNRIGACPVCGEDLVHSFDKRHGDRHYGVYGCPSCEIGVTYISPDDGRKEYHEFNDGEIEVSFEPGY